MSAPLCIQCGSLALTRERATPSRTFCGRTCQTVAYALVDAGGSKRAYSDIETPPLT